MNAAPSKVQELVRSEHPAASGWVDWLHAHGLLQDIALIVGKNLGWKVDPTQQARWRRGSAACEKPRAVQRAFLGQLAQALAHADDERDEPLVDAISRCEAESRVRNWARLEIEFETMLSAGVLAAARDALVAEWQSLCADPAWAPSPPDASEVQHENLGDGAAEASGTKFYDTGDKVLEQPGLQEPIADLLGVVWNAAQQLGGPESRLPRDHDAQCALIEGLWKRALGRADDFAVAQARDTVRATAIEELGNDSGALHLVETEVLVRLALFCMAWQSAPDANRFLLWAASTWRNAEKSRAANVRPARGPNIPLDAQARGKAWPTRETFDIFMRMGQLLRNSQPFAHDAALMSKLHTWVDASTGDYEPRMGNLETFVRGQQDRLMAIADYATLTSEARKVFIRDAHALYFDGSGQLREEFCARNAWGQPVRSTAGSLHGSTPTVSLLDLPAGALPPYWFCAYGGTAYPLLLGAYNSTTRRGPDADAAMRLALLAFCAPLHKDETHRAWFTDSPGEQALRYIVLRYLDAQPQLCGAVLRRLKEDLQ